MNQMNMAGFNAGNAGLGNMPMAQHVPNGAGVRMVDEQEDPNYEARLNTFIYGYFCTKGLWELARTLKNSGVEFDPPIARSDINGAEDNAMQSDSKDGIEKRPDDLPDVNMLNDANGGSFLLQWFSLFWDVYFASRKNPRASNHANIYVQHTQQQARMRQETQQQMLRGMPGMVPGGMENYQHRMMQFQNGMQPNDNLRQKALQNTRSGYPATPQQMQQMRQHQMMQQQMRRDPSDMDINGQRPRTPSAGDHAPSPSKRQRLDGVPFNPQMMPNGRGPPHGMPGQQMMGDAALNANSMLVNNGINPGNLSDSQFASFQQQNPAVQQKSIQVYAQNLAKNQRQQSLSKGGGMSDQGSPIMPPGMELGAVPDYYNGNPTTIQMRGAPPTAPNGGAGGNLALQDYQMQLMLLEQQNKKRLLMARQEQDTVSGRPDGQPGMPGAPGFAPGMSPQGSRGGPSPGPSEQTKRGTPKMNAVGLPGSPMPDGSMRGSPAAMNFNQMNPEIYAQMNGGMRPPPSSHPGFNGQLNPQQVDAMQRAQRGMMPNGGNWQQGPQGPAPMIQQPQPQQPAQMGTPQQRNDMPPPQGVPANANANGRTGSPTVAPSPQPASKAAPKGKKDTKDRKRPTKKNSAPSVAATPASEAEANPPATPTPSTPITPSHPQSFTTKNDGPGQANMMPGMNTAATPQLAQPQQDTNGINQFTGLEGGDDSYPMSFNPDINNSDLLENFDFEQFLQSTDGGTFEFDASAFEATDPIEAGVGDPS